MFCGSRRHLGNCEVKTVIVDRRKRIDFDLTAHVYQRHVLLNDDSALIVCEVTHHGQALAGEVGYLHQGMQDFS
jgi:hypothetical protein